MADSTPIPERVASLETVSAAHSEEIADIYQQIRAATAANNETSRLQALTQLQLDTLSVNATESKGILTQLQQAHWSARGAAAVIGTLAGVLGTIVGVILSYVLKGH